MDIRLVVVLVYMALLMILGTYSGKMIKGFSDFLVGARMFSWWPIALTFAAAWTGGAACTALIGTAYTKGVSAIWYWWAIVVPYVLNAFTLAGPLRKSGAHTIADLLSARYDERVAAVAAITQALGYMFLNSAQVVAGGMWLKSLAGIPFVWGVIITAVIVVIYTYAGGLIACTITDVLQQVVSMGAFVAALVFISTRGGSGLSSLSPELLSLSAGFNTRQFLAWIVSFSLGHMGMQSTFMRIAQAKDEKQAKMGQLMGGVVLFFVSILVVLIGMQNRALFGGSIKSGDVALKMVAALPPIIAGLWAAGVLSAVMSTADNNLLASTGLFAREIYGKYINPSATDKQKLFMARALCIPGMIVPVLGGIYAADILGWITKGMAMNGMISLAVFGALYWKRATAEGAFASALGAMITFLVWTFSNNPFKIEAVFVGAGVGLVLLVVVSLMTKPRPAAEIDALWSGELRKDEA